MEEVVVVIDRGDGDGDGGGGGDDADRGGGDGAGADGGGDGSHRAVTVVLWHHSEVLSVFHTLQFLDFSQSV